MSSNKPTSKLALPSTPVHPVVKRLLSSSPASFADLLNTKRTKVDVIERPSSQAPDIDFDVFGPTSMVLEPCTLSAIEEDGVDKDDDNEADTPGREVIEISSDPVLPSADDNSLWSMHTATSESDGAYGDKVINIAPEIKHFLLQRGPDQLIGGNGYPTVVYINTQTGKMYQCIVDRELFFRRRDLSGNDDRALWLQTNIYLGDLRDRCINDSDKKREDFPILHRNGHQFIITSDPLTTDEDAPLHLKDTVKQEWKRLISRYGDLNDIQNEQRSLIDKAFFLLGHYQTAIASRDLLVAMRINNLLDNLRAALNDLLILEYVIRELFYSDTYPQFILATSST